jgi:hypothetical protein
MSEVPPLPASSDLMLGLCLGHPDTEATMPFKKELAATRIELEPLTLYQKFEHVSILVVSGLIAIVIVLAIWNLALKILTSALSSSFVPTDYAVFQAVFGMILTVIIAL